MTDQMTIIHNQTEQIQHTSSSASSDPWNLDTWNRGLRSCGKTTKIRNMSN